MYNSVTPTPTPQFPRPKKQTVQPILNSFKTIDRNHTETQYRQAGLILEGLLVDGNLSLETQCLQTSDF